MYIKPVVLLGSYYLNFSVARLNSEFLSRPIDIDVVTVFNTQYSILFTVLIVPLWMDSPDFFFLVLTIVFIKHFMQCLTQSKHAVNVSWDR